MKMKRMRSLFILFFIYIVTVLSSKYVGESYHTHFYPLYDRYLSALFSRVSFSVGDFLYLIVGFWILIALIRLLLKKQWLYCMKYIGICIFAFLCMFTFSWGLNNYKTPLHEKLGLEKQYSAEDLDLFIYKKIESINLLHLEWKKDANAVVDIEKDYEYFYKEAKENMAKVWFLKSYSLEAISPAKPSIYSWLLTRAGFSGYFNPFTHENQINTYIPSVGMPVTYTHELTHQLGFASEAEANFIAYYTLKQSKNKLLVYCAELYGLKYALKEIRKTNEEKYLLLLSQLNPGIVQNIQDSEAFWQKNKNFSSNLLKPLYGVFLKANNQKQGIQSYNLMVNLMINYEKKYGVML